MGQKQASSVRVLGFDVSKASVTIFDTHASSVHEVGNSVKAIRAFLKTLSGQINLAVLEPTGGYEADALQALSEANISIHRANTVLVKAFIRSLGVQGKTDALDARGLAEYGQERFHKLSRFTPNTKERDALRELVLRRSELVNARSAEKTRLKGPSGKSATSSYLRHIAFLDREIKKLDQQILSCCKQSEELGKTVAVLQAVPGVGQVTASALCALMPELGHLSRRQAASLAGLAPHPRDSGTLKGYRRVRPGRRDLKRILFMAAMVAVKWNPSFKAFYERLITNGKKRIVALTAAMRKLIVVLNAKVRDSMIKNPAQPA